MTPPEPPTDDLVTVTEISKIAGVALPTVSNWKRRHDDFPTPVRQGAKGPLFQRLEVHEWLAAHHKLNKASPDTRSPRAKPSPTAAPQTSSRSAGAPATGKPRPSRRSDATGPTTSPGGRSPATRSSRTWLDAVDGIRQAGPHPELLPIALAALAGRPLPEQSIRPGTSVAGLRTASDALNADQRLAAAQQLLEDYTDTRDSAVHATPRPVAQLMAALLGPRPATYDPASGLGALLAAAATAGPTALHGQEINELTAEASHAYLQLNGTEADIRVGHSLYDDRFAGELFPGIVTAPPFGQRLDPDQISSADPRWAFVTPTRNADEAWLQHVLHHLEPGGRAVMQVAPSVLAASGNIGQLRASLLRSGLLRAVIQLPAGCVAGVHSKFLTALIMLERPQNLVPAPNVLVVDPDLPGLDRGTWTSGDIDSVVSTLNQWLESPDETVELPAGYRAVGLEELSEVDFDLTPRRLLTPATTQHRPLREIRAELVRSADATGAAVDQLRQLLLDVRSTTPNRRQATPRLPLASVPGVRVERAMRPQRLAKSGAVPVHTPQNLATGDQPTLFLPGTELADDQPPHTTRPGDVLVVIDGPQLGAVYLTEQPLVASSQFAVIRLTDGELDARYLTQWLRGHEAQHQLQRSAVGTTLRRVALQDLRQLPVPVPSAATQQRIGLLHNHLSAIHAASDAISSSLTDLNDLAANAVGAALPPTEAQR